MKDKMEWLIVLVVIILIFVIVYLITRKRKKKYLIFEDTKETPEGTEKHWWVRDRKFNSLNEAREFAKFLKKS